MRQMTSVVGRPALQPYWALGMHQAGSGYASLEEVQAAVGSYTAAGLPLEALWTDVDARERHRRLPCCCCLPACLRCAVAMQALVASPSLPCPAHHACMSSPGLHPLHPRPRALPARPHARLAGGPGVHRPALGAGGGPRCVELLACGVVVGFWQLQAGCPRNAVPLTCPPLPESPLVFQASRCKTRRRPSTRPTWTAWSRACLWRACGARTPTPARQVLARSGVKRGPCSAVQPHPRWLAPELPLRD